LWLHYGATINKVIHIRGASESLRARLDSSAEKNHRSLNQEALERLERSFEVEDALVNARDQKWIDEAMSGEFRPGSVARLREIAAQARGS
jgi:predicted transcriptional regulator